MTSRYQEILLPEQHEKIIDYVIKELKSNSQIPASKVEKFRSILRRGRAIPGFKDPIKAPSPMLKQSMAETLEGSQTFKKLLIDVWAGTQPKLRKSIMNHLNSLPSEAYYGDDIDEDFWDAQISLLAEKHSKYEENEILLMTKYCYPAAQANAKRSASITNASASPTVTPTVTMDTVPSALFGIIDRLRALPAESNAWHEEIPQFVADLNDLISAKEEERNRLNRLLDYLNEMQDEFASELEFFQRKDEDWNIHYLVNSGEISEAERLLQELRTALEGYRSIRDIAGTLAEERKRREQCQNLEDSIERILNRLDDLTDPPDDTPIGAPVQSEELPGNAHETAADSTSENKSQPEADSELRAELQSVRDDYDALLGAHNALKQDNKSAANLNRSLQGEITGLEDDKRTFAQEIAELKDKLQIAEKQEFVWRNAYESEMSSKDSSAPEPIPSEIESIRQALALAEARYGDKLLIHLNKKSDPDYDYNRPKEAWDALEWLATTYHQTQTGKIRVKDLNESIRKTCSGWDYKPDQTDITVNTYREWYTTSINGAAYQLRRHIGKGTGRQNSNIIRIAFTWDDRSQRVIIGYIGPHQRSRAS